MHLPNIIRVHQAIARLRLLFLILNVNALQGSVFYDLCIMANAQPLEHLSQVDEALARYAQQLDGAIDAVIDQNVSNYPILVWQRGAELEIGVPLIAVANPGSWEVRMTTLEELSTKNLMRPDRVKGFREVFSDARKQYCLFVIGEAGAQFAFRPRG